MDGSKFVELRRQMEENNQDIQEFLGDMDQWRSRLAQKNAKLLIESKVADEHLPSIRNVLHKKKKKTKKNIQVFIFNNFIFLAWSWLN